LQQVFSPVARKGINIHDPAGEPDREKRKNEKDQVDPRVRWSGFGDPSDQHHTVPVFIHAEDGRQPQRFDCLS
jgi:hypothetical protein